MAASYVHPIEQPSNDPDDVLFNSLYGVRTIELNRPRKLNSLNSSMVRKIIPRLKVLFIINLLSNTTNVLLPKQWENSQLANIVIIAGAGPKAFCAGGDVATLAEQNATGPKGQALSRTYFGLEYQLDHLIATYSKPYVAYMDGITMGGGAGLSVHAPFRIATERTRFAMPETRIGFFPDVGTSFFLPRLEGYIGTYLALTAAELGGVNAFYAGIATHYIDSSMLPSLTARLSELEFKDYDTRERRHSLIASTIGEFSTGLPHNEPELISGNIRLAIDRCFKFAEVEQIIQQLEIEKNGPLAGWAEKTLKALSQHSPTSLKVTLRLMHLGLKWPITYAFQREYHIAAKFMAHHDFVSGVSSRLIQKPPTAPTWQPAVLSQIRDEHVDRFFEVEGEERLELVGAEANWVDYPSQMGLPRESEIRRLFEEMRESGEWRKGRTGGAETERERNKEREKDLVERGMSEKDVAVRDMTESMVREMLKRTDGKAGVREQVEEVLRRCCVVGKKDGLLMWRHRKQDEEREIGFF